MKIKAISILIGLILLIMTIVYTNYFTNSTDIFNNVNYTLDLQNKQEYITYIKEDSVNIEKEFIRKLNENNK